MGGFGTSLVTTTPNDHQRERTGIQCTLHIMRARPEKINVLAPDKPLEYTTKPFLCSEMGNQTMGLGFWDKEIAKRG